MSKIQSVLLSLLPASWAQRAEQESRQWMLQCPDCGYEISVWDAGGIRWKADAIASDCRNPRRRMKCPACRKQTWFKIYKRENK